MSVKGLISLSVMNLTLLVSNKKRENPYAKDLTQAGVLKRNTFLNRVIGL
jgi:hypothetical protein